MRLPFLDREREISRLRGCFEGREPSFAVLFGRRRCGKSRLLREAVAGKKCAYYVGDERDAALQVRSAAQAAAAVVPGLDQVEYQGWEPLLDRWWREAPAGAVLTLDEFPWIVTASPELPALLQKKIDANTTRPIHTVICGSSQRMMQGFVLDRNAPLYGRAKEILAVRPLGVHWLGRAFGEKDARKIVDMHATWGGIPRYWELARDFKDHRAAVRSLVLDPLGVLYQEPERLLYDHMRELSQAATVLALIGQGCRKISEIAGRIGKPATALSRPLQRLLKLGFVRRETPFGQEPRDTKRSIYAIDDPFLSFWFRFVEPNRSRLEAGLIGAVELDIGRSWDGFVGAAWEALAREAVPKLVIGGREWEPAGKWWGSGIDRTPLEADIVARSTDGKAVLVGEAKLNAAPRDLDRLKKMLADKAHRLPVTQDLAVVTCAFAASAPLGRGPQDLQVVSGRDVIAVMR
ncbi:MAG: ATP-binding protein [Deltaproteobacteria bacterium]|nr:ATP-binding protein [Deltaproteobacteria bacterium]